MSLLTGVIRQSLGYYSHGSTGRAIRARSLDRNIITPIDVHQEAQDSLPTAQTPEARATQEAIQHVKEEIMEVPDPRENHKCKGTEFPRGGEYLSLRSEGSLTRRGGPEIILPYGKLKPGTTESGERGVTRNH